MKRLAVLLLWCAPLLAQTAAAPKPLLIVKAAHLLDVRSGRTLDNQAILIDQGTIKEVGDAATIAVHAPGAQILDLGSATLLPGLIDAHNHLLGNPKDLSPAQSLRTSSAQAALWGAHNLRTWLDHGFTSLRDACEPDAFYGQIALRDSVNMGLIPGPRMVVAGSCISVTGGHGDADLLAPDQALP
jgi:imidazolonepropionase-like amidohydrolase